ncbi:MAG TPA: hypothetical protein VK791_08595 [bacterium]|jgi:hypothetical protein|nr:hypothetical protein [bacterium]
MRSIYSKLFLGVLGFCLILAGTAQAGPSTTSHPPLFLKVQTADGKAIQAPVVKFKALSMAVVATLIKEGKMTPTQSSEKGGKNFGNMTFYLGQDVSSDFINWAKASMAQTDGTISKDSGEFMLPAWGGNGSMDFTMEGLKVVGFIPAEGENGIQLVLAADKTESNPPINFKK